MKLKMIKKKNTKFEQCSMSGWVKHTLNLVITLNYT